MKIKFFFVLLLSYLINTSIGISEEKVYIELTVENKIITNVDINKEKKYLFALNNNLSITASDSVIVLLVRHSRISGVFLS